jgi:urease gamma subunit
MVQTRERTLEEIKAQAFYTEIEAIALIRDIVEQGAREGFCTTDELSAVLDKIATGETITYRGIKAGIVEALNRKGAEGLNTSYIYAYMRRGGDNVPMATIETALLELERDGTIEAQRDGGGLTIFRIKTQSLPPADVKL